jgi:hypothetical protein
MTTASSGFGCPLYIMNERGEATSQLKADSKNYLMCNQVVAATEATKEALPIKLLAANSPARVKKHLD